MEKIRGNDSDNEEVDDYNKLMKELVFEPKKAKAQDRLKTDEEIIKEEKERLEKLEELRLMRMKGGKDEEEPDEDSENDQNDDENGQNEEESEESETEDGEDEYSDLEESETEEMPEEKSKKSPNKTKIPVNQDSEVTKDESDSKKELQFTYSVPKSYEGLQELFENRAPKVTKFVTVWNFQDFPIIQNFT